MEPTTSNGLKFPTTGTIKDSKDVPWGTQGNGARRMAQSCEARIESSCGRRESSQKPCEKKEVSCEPESVFDLKSCEQKVSSMAGHSGHVQSSVWHSQGYQTHSTVCLGSRKKRWWSFLCLPQLPWIFVSGGRQLVHVLGSDWMLLTTRTFYTLCKYRRKYAILPKGCATHKNLEALSECSKFEYQV